MDFISISYGIRNVVQRVEAFKEFNRVLKKGGMLVILEFTKPQKENIMGSFVKWYMKKAIPFIGSLISKHNDAYSYLPNSIEAFSTTKNLKDEMIQSGFKECFIQAYSFEISTLFIMKKI
jgi:demethylmenaquinone methyltransferase/2-methoxy-6-polyprenyl-1,4-benzoquinol methylase